MLSSDLNPDHKSKLMNIAKLTSNLLIPIAASIALLFAVQSAQAATMPVADVDFGLISPVPGSYTTSIDLPDEDPNVRWFQFTLGAVSNVSLDTFGSEVADTLLALYDPTGVLLGQNYDCDPVLSYHSCLSFSALQPASYLAGVVEYYSFFDFGTGSVFFVEFQPMWELDNASDRGDDGVTLNIQVEAISPTVVPVPAAFWLFGTALIGFIGFSRRTTI
jgi:hypothetical protein